MSSSVSPSQHPTPSHQGPSTSDEGHDTPLHQEHEVLVHHASESNAGDTSNAEAAADTQADVLRCMLSTDVSPFGEHILPCGEGFADLDSLMIHLWDTHGPRGPDCMRLDCLWLTNGDHLCGENLRKSGYKRHISVHLGLRVVCEDCGQSFSRKDSVKKHKKEKHEAE